MLRCNLALWRESNNEWEHILWLFPVPDSAKKRKKKKKFNIADVISVTCTIWLLWRHVKTHYTLRVFTKEPIWEQETKFECMNNKQCMLLSMWVNWYSFCYKHITLFSLTCCFTRQVIPHATSRANWISWLSERTTLCVDVSLGLQSSLVFLECSKRKSLRLPCLMCDITMNIGSEERLK